MELKVIARYKCDFKTKFGLPRQSGIAPSITGEIVFEDEYRDENALRGIEEYSHLWLLWGFENENGTWDGKTVTSLERKTSAMASSKGYLDYILEQLSALDEVSYRAMMGEYIIYYRGKIIGGIYDDRFLVKPVKSAIRYMTNAEYESPYDGAKEMLIVDDVDNRAYLEGLFTAMYDELPEPKPKKKKVR